MSTRNLPAKSKSIPIRGASFSHKSETLEKGTSCSVFSMRSARQGVQVSRCSLDIALLMAKQDKAYVSAFEAATQIAANHFEDEIYRRGFEGYDRPVTYQGEITDRYTDYSDTLAIFALKGLRPEKYRDNAHCIMACYHNDVGRVSLTPSCARQDPEPIF